MVYSGAGWTRRAALRSVGGAVVGGALAAGTVDPVSGQSDEAWPQFGYDDARTGHAPGNTGPVADIERKWTFETEGAYEGDDNAEWSSPAVVGGTLYIGRLVDRKVYAIDADSGTKEWEFRASTGITASPTVVEGTVYIGDLDNGVYALDALDGTEEWTHRLDADDYGSQESGVTTAPAVVDGTVYCASRDHYVYAIEPPIGGSIGHTKWSFDTSGPVSSSPTVVDETVYVGGGSSVYAIDADDGTERWSFETGDSVWKSSASVGDGVVYIGDSAGTVYALDANDGSERWSFETDDSIQSSPAVADGTVYVGSWDDFLYALDAADGTERWRYDTGTGPSSSPAVVDGTVYVGDDGGAMIALSADDGTERWEFGTGGRAVTSSPAVANGSVYVGADDGDVYAITGSTTVPADGGAEDAEGGDDSGGTPNVGLLAAGVGAISAVGGLWYRRRNGGSGGDTEDRTGEEPATDRGDVARTGSTGVASGSEGGAPSGGRRSGGLDGGDERREEALTLATHGEFDEALSALDEAERAYRDALDAAQSSDRARDRLERLGDDRRTIHHDRLDARRETLRTELDRAADYVDTDAERARERLSELAPRIDALRDRTAELGFDELEVEAAALHSDREDLLADVETATADRDTTTTSRDTTTADADTTTTDRDTTTSDVETTTADADTATTDRDTTTVGGPPNRIPGAPDVSVEYDALSDEEPIGTSGNAEVVRVVLPTPTGDVTLAIKRPHLRGTLHTDTVERLLAEAETWDALDDHDHIVGVVDYGSHPVPWVAMEYMDGGDLSDRSGDLALDQALWTATGIAEGVHHAHRHGVAHLDLKPANVLFRSVEDAWDVPKVADWGLSKHLLDRSESVEGPSPQYAAPEQLDDEYGATDDITDVYQLGAVCYELFTGRPPFEGKPMEAMRGVLNDAPTPPSDVADVPPELDDVLLTALAKEKAERYDGVLLFRDALQGLSER